MSRTHKRNAALAPVLILLTFLRADAAKSEAGETSRLHGSTSAQVEAILSPTHAHGLRFDTLASLSEAVLPQLARALNDPSEKQRWLNALTAIGVIGGARSQSVIEEFIWGRFKGELDIDTFRAMMIAVEALGWSKSGPTTEALKQLTDGTNPEHWRSLPWTHTIAGSPDYARVILSEVAINGLSYTGTASAESTLISLSRSPHHRRQVGNIEEGLIRNRAVRERGLRACWGEGKSK